MIKYWDEVLLNKWWQRKLRKLGYKQYKVKEKVGVCPLCLKSDTLFRATGQITLCNRCYRRFLDSRVEHRAKVKIFPLMTQCNVCGKFIVRAVIVWDFWCCLKCMWRKLGKQKGKMKYAGELIW